MRVRAFDGPTAVESGSPKSPSASVGVSGLAACPCSTVLHGLRFCVAVSMSGSSVEGKEPHVDPGRRALHDPLQTVKLLRSRRSRDQLDGKLRPGAKTANAPE